MNDANLLKIYKAPQKCAYFMGYIALHVLWDILHITISYLQMPSGDMWYVQLDLTESSRRIDVNKVVQQKSKQGFWK